MFWFLTLQTSPFDWLIGVYFWADGLVFLVLLLQRSTFCGTKTPSLFLAFLFFFCKTEPHCFLLFSGLKCRSLPFIAFWQWILRPLVALMKLSLLSCPLLTLPESTKLDPIDDFANFISKFYTDLYLYNDFVTFSNTQHDLLYYLSSS